MEFLSDGTALLTVGLLGGAFGETGAPALAGFLGWGGIMDGDETGMVTKCR